MRAIGRCGSGGLVGLLAARCQILVVNLVHGLTDPVRHARSWDGEADVTESLKQFGRDVVRTVFVAHDSQMATLSSETMRPSGSDSPKKASRRSENPLGMARGMAHPDGGTQHEDAGIENLPSYLGPFVPAALV